MTAAAPTILGRECRHAIYSEARDGGSDIHLIKEYVHLSDGTMTINRRIKENYEREFWITKEAFRNHQDKKEYEEESKLQRFTTRQSDLNNRVSKALYQRPAGKTTLKQLAESPYLYGCDILTSCLIKNDYQKHFKDIKPTQASLGVLDIEKDVTYGTNEITLISLTFKERAIVAINTSFLADTEYNRKMIDAKIEEHLGDVIKERKVTITKYFGRTQGECIKAVIRKAHEWSPDFIAIWNINYDLPQIINACRAENIDLAALFSDPIVPRQYQHFKYIPGKDKKVTQSGKESPKHWADIWHTVECPATFYFVDAGVIYKFLRTANGMEPSYGLDDVLTRNIGRGKLSIPEVDHLTKLAWHQAMQAHYKYEYVAYNLFDDFGVELLDESTGDIGRVMSVLCGISDYRHFKSNPRKIVDDLHFFYRERNKVIATTGVEVEVDDDDLVIGLKGWIATLSAQLIEENGIEAFEEFPRLASMIRIHCADLDIEGTYPHIEVAANIAKETTNRELVSIDGLNEELRREIGIDISGGPINALAIAHKVYGLPTPHVWAMEIAALYGKEIPMMHITEVEREFDVLEDEEAEMTYEE